MSNWGMNFEGHTPMFGRMMPEGNWLVEVASEEHRPSDANNKGDNIRITFKGLNGEADGSTVRTTLYILNDNFTGSDGHAGATKDNWYNLMVACGVKPKNFGDMREVARALVGKRLGVQVVHTSGTGANADKTYANVNGFMSAQVVGANAASDDGDDEGGDLGGLAALA